MKKLHYKTGDKVSCRVGPFVPTNYQTTHQKTLVTCENCKRSVGLTKVVMKGNLTAAMITFSLGRKSVKVPVSDFTFEFQNVQALEDPPEITFVKREPKPCVTATCKLDEYGREALLGLFFEQSK